MLVQEKTIRPWVYTEGAIFLLLPEDLATAWGGAGLSDNFLARDPNDPPDSDYDRATRTQAYLDLLEVGGRQSLVIGQAEYDTTWWPSIVPGREAGFVLRWSCSRGGSEEHLLRQLRRLPPGEPCGPVVRFEASHPTLLLFDAAVSGEKILAGSLRIFVPPGEYDVTSEWARPDDETEMLIHRFLKV